MDAKMTIGEVYKIKLYPSNIYTLEKIRKMVQIKHFHPGITEERFPRLLGGIANVRMATFSKEYTKLEALKEIRANGLKIGLFDHLVGLLLDVPLVAQGKPIVSLGSSHTLMPGGEIRYPVAANNLHWQSWLLLAVKTWNPCYHVLVIDPDQPPSSVAPSTL